MDGQCTSRYLRMSINKGEQIVSMEEEIQLMRTYIEIMQKRFQNKFEVFYELEQDTLQIPIPKLSLQPLVENALHPRHLALRPEKSASYYPFLEGGRRGGHSN